MLHIELTSAHKTEILLSLFSQVATESFFLPLVGGWGSWERNKSMIEPQGGE